MMSTNQKITIGLSLVIFIFLLRVLDPILSPFLFAALLAYLGDPLVNKFTRCYCPRTLSVLVVFFIMLSFALLFLFLLIPMIERQISLFYSNLPQMISWMQLHALPWISQHLGLNLSVDVVALKQTLGRHWQQAGSAMNILWHTVTRSSLVLIKWGTNLFLVPVVAFYLMRDWQKALNAFKGLLPRTLEPTVTRLAVDCDIIIGAFFKGQLLVMLSLGMIYSVGLWIVGLNLALLIGLLAGLFSIVPYMGFIVGLLSALIVGAVQFQTLQPLFYVFIVFGIGQMAEGMILTPLLVGDRIGLHPVAVIFSILAGGHLFGFVGVLLALPVASVIMVLLRYMHKQYMQSELYSN